MTPAVASNRAIKDFVARWKELPCVEEEHSRSFWIEFVEQVLGIPNATRILEFERKVKGRKIDVFYEDMGILIEQKGRGISLDEATVRSKKAGPETPFQQAKWYADNLPYSIRPRWIITCNFDEFRIYDLDREDYEEYVSVELSELPDQVHLFGFFLDESNSRLVKERELSIQAGNIVGDLYRAFEGQYKNLESDSREQRSLNILIVRLVFLLYAEDAGLLQSHQAFGKYLQQFPAERMRSALIDLFDALDTPEDKRDPYISDDLASFPYVNGGLFADEGIIVPQFTEQMRVDLILNASIAFDWKDISPTIFGAVFESTLNPETRHQGGMHYTSIENIHKVIDPLFLDNLKAELAEIEGLKVEKTRRLRLRRFQEKLAGISVFDPACGSGNFLTESFLSLRALENRVLESLQGEQMGFGFDGDADPIKVGINQLYGIEINDFAVSVAKTALWIAEEQMMEATQEILYCDLDFLPLKSNSNICEGNALRIDWSEVLSPEECAYVIGNPPFLGYSNLSASQKEDRAAIFGKAGGTLDYVACWYKKAADYTRGTHGRCAFVSTNSICQGQQVEPLWKPLFEDGVAIDFAYPTFAWGNEASDQAHVHVVIVGFSREGMRPKRLFGSAGAVEVANISGYLAATPSVFISKRSKPLCCAPEMAMGFKPADNGNLILSMEDRESLLSVEPQAEGFVRPFSMGAEFINGISRYCLWLADDADRDLSAYPVVAARVEACRAWRQDQTKTGDAYKLKDTPGLFRPCGKFKDGAYIAAPSVSSERRKYVPMGFVDNGMIPGNQLYFVPNGGLYHFGVLMSQSHNAWMRMVCGRLESRYRYTNTIVYNTFPWPGARPENLSLPVGQLVSPEARHRIEACAQGVMDARSGYADATLADLYDPDKMPADLLAAHRALDAAVEAAYGIDLDGDEEAMVSHLFQLYASLTA